MINYLLNIPDETAMLFIFQNNYLVSITAFLICCKVSYFLLTKRRSWKLYHMVYFNSNHILLSTSRKSSRNKKIQNGLSLAIVVVLCQIALNCLLMPA